MVPGSLWDMKSFFLSTEKGVLMKVKVKGILLGYDALDARLLQ